MTDHRQGIEHLKRVVEPVEAAYLTADQVGELLQLSAKSVYRLAKADPTMPMLKLGTTVRFPKERLLAWLRAREQGRPPTRSLSAVPPKSAPAKEMRNV